jgi:DNA-binding LytR/AlgR family response regulator
MLLVAICDDLQYDNLRIKNFINEYCLRDAYDINILTFDNGEDLVKYHKCGKPFFDVIFLDIYMNAMNGIKTAKKIREYDQECKIIFTTSSTEHALESFDVTPFNYLVKPISKSVFDSAFEKVLRTINKEKQKSLTVKLGTAFQTIFYKDILFIESTAKTLNIRMAKNKSLAFASKLDDIEKQINDKRFLRCHKSFLVNMDYVLCLEAYSFKLIDNTMIPVAQRNFANTKNLFYNFIMDKSNIKNDLENET